MFIVCRLRFSARCRTVSTPRRTVGAVIMLTAVLRMVLADDNFLVREGVAALLW